MQFSLSDLNRRAGELADLALVQPVVLTKRGRRQLVLLSAATYDALLAASGGKAPEEPMSAPPASRPKALETGLARLRSVETSEEP